jgi:hypothetical protein
MHVFVVGEVCLFHLFLFDVDLAVTLVKNVEAFCATFFAPFELNRLIYLLSLIQCPI